MDNKLTSFLTAEDTEELKARIKDSVEELWRLFIVDQVMWGVCLPANVSDCQRLGESAGFCPKTSSNLGGGGSAGCLLLYFFQNLAYRFLWKGIIYKINAIPHKKKQKLQGRRQGSLKDILT